MIFREICLGFSGYHNEDPRGKEFFIYSFCIADMYHRLFVKKGGINRKSSILRLNIHLTPIEEYKEKNPFNAGGYYNIYLSFDFEHYFAQKEWEKKKIMLDLVHKGMLSVHEKLVVKKELLEEIYQECLDAHLQNKWLLQYRYIRSPSHEYYAGIECDWDLTTFTTTLIILDKAKKEIGRKLLFTKEASYGEMIYHSKRKWKSRSCFSIEIEHYIFTKGKLTEWSVDVEKEIVKSVHLKQ